MSRVNVKIKYPKEYTHEGAEAARIPVDKQLRRSVLSCLLWEDEFYESGEDIAERIISLVAQASPGNTNALAIEARVVYHLRHVPLLLCSALAKVGKLRWGTVAAVVRRADELAELLAIHAKVNETTPDKIKRILSKQMRLGLAAAFGRFNEYQLAKYDRAGAVRLRDVLNLVHPVPKDQAQADLWKRLLDKSLKVPDTWEVALSGGKDKKETFTRLLTEGAEGDDGRKYPWGYLALLRNLRNMEKADVDASLVEDAILARKGGADKVFPFRFIAAAKATPQFEGALDTAMLANLAEVPKLPGRTMIIVDVSGSMTAPLSVRSEMNRANSACALAAVARELCEKPVIYATAGNDSTRVHKTALVPARRGMALVDAIWAMSEPLGRGGIFLKQVMDYLAEKNIDRVIVLTDEQDCDNSKAGAPAKAQLFAPRNYMCNVSGHKNGIGYGRWTHIDGFSENVIRYIAAIETEDQEKKTSNNEMG